MSKLKHVEFGLAYTGMWLAIICFWLVPIGAILWHDPSILPLMMPLLAITFLCGFIAFTIDARWLEPHKMDLKKSIPLVNYAGQWPTPNNTYTPTPAGANTPCPCVTCYGHNQGFPPGVRCECSQCDQHYYHLMGGGSLGNIGVIR